MWNAHRFEIGQNGQNGHSLDSKIEFVLTQVNCFARRIEVGQNGQNGHSLDSDLIELIPTLKVVIHNALSVGLGMPMYMGHFA